MMHVGGGIMMHVGGGIMMHVGGGIMMHVGGGIMMHVGACHEYIGGCSVHWRDIMITSGDVGDILYIGVFNRN